MSITDELRDWVSNHYSGWSSKQAKGFAIADRIDAEHEALRDQLETSERQKESYREDLLAANRQVHASYNDGFDEGFASADDWLTQHEDAMAEHGWVRLPVDADGVPLHIGELVDEALPFGGYAAPAPIDTMELYRGASGYGWMVKLDTENRASISPMLLRHHYAPTVEDLLQEMLYKAHIYDEREMELLPDLIAEYASKLRLAGDDE